MLSDKYSGLYENDHFNQAQAEFKKVLNGKSKQAQAEFKKVLNGQSKLAAQKKRGEKGGCVPCTQGLALYTHSKRWTVLFQVGRSRTKGCIAFQLKINMWSNLEND